MFWPDILTLQHFYASLLGKRVTRYLENAIMARWGEAKGEVIAGLGFVTPVLSALQAHNRVVAVMPPCQGVAHWPASNLTCLSDEALLPFSDGSIDRLILLHLLEHTPYATETLREIWRVLKPGGRLLTFVPNRLGLWAHSERTPFGQGHPFYATALMHLLENSLFTTRYQGTLLFFPPSARSGFAPSLWEKLGNAWLKPFGGIVMVESEKTLYAPIREPVRQNMQPPRRLPAFVPG